ncbi:MAG: hypothetical protein P8010_17545 [Desulfosarcinaceae bacterium]
MATLTNRLQGSAATIVPTTEMQRTLKNLNAPYTKETAQTVGATLGADLAVTGSVTIVSNAVSTDIQLWQLPEGTSIVNFHASGDRPEAVLEHLDQFILQVERDVFGKQPPTAATASSPSPESAAAAPGPPPLSWKSNRLDIDVSGMAVADLDSTPGDEIALIDDKDLLIYRRAGNALRQVAKIEGEPYIHLIAVDAADINRNGIPEIFVSAFHVRQGNPHSFVMEWDENQNRYTRRFDGLPTYFRVTELPDQGQRLVGQKKGMDSFFGGQPSELVWHDGQYRDGSPLPLPSDVNLYEFVLGTFLPDGTRTIAALTPGKKLSLYNNPKDRFWSGDISYGGSSVYLDDSQTLENRSKQLKQIGEETLKRYYLHPRMLMTDLDGDGIQELLIVQNHDAAKGIFRRSRILNRGHVVCLQWKPLGPVTKWETPQVSGHITDMALVDTRGDGPRELIYAVVERETKGLDTHRSYLVTHTLAASN